MQLISGDPSFATDAAAWAALNREPAWVASSLGVGSIAYLATGQGVVRFRVVAQLPSPGGSSPGLLPGLVGSQPALVSLVGSPPGATLLLKTAGGAAPRALAHDLQRAVLAEGADATPTLQLLRAQYDAHLGAQPVLVGM